MHWLSTSRCMQAQIGQLVVLYFWERVTLYGQTCWTSTVEKGGKHMCGRDVGLHIFVCYFGTFRNALALVSLR